MRRPSRLLVGASGTAVLAAAVLGLGVSPAPAGTGGDVHYFEVRVVGTGSATVDYGEDGRAPGLTTAIGVDGTESLSWRWEVLAAAKSVGNGPLLSQAEAIRDRGVLEASVHSYSVQMGVYHEEPLCKDRQGKTLFVSSDGRGLSPSRSSLGEYYAQPRTVAVRGGGFLVDSAFAPYCLHGWVGHGLKYVHGASGQLAPVPRGAFNPRSDRSYEHTYRRPHFSIGLHGEANSEHTFEGEAELEVEIKAVSEQRFHKRADDFNSLRAGHSVDYKVPPGPTP